MLNALAYRASTVSKSIICLLALATSACATFERTDSEAEAAEQLHAASPASQQKDSEQKGSQQKDSQQKSSQQIDQAVHEPEYKAAVRQMAAARDEFLSNPDFLEQFKRLNELEQQALQLAADEPLKLGSLGSAILDIYPASFTGHYVLQQFYAHVDAADAQNRHAALLVHLQNQMRAHGDGTRDKPLPIMTVYDAQTHAQSLQQSPVGSIYQSNSRLPLGYLLISRPQHGKLEQTSYDLQHLLTAFADAAERKLPPAQTNDPATGSVPDGANSAPPTVEAEFSFSNNPWVLIRLFAAGGDNGAHTAIGAYLASLQKYDQSIGWLRMASRSGNVLANRLLARIYFTKAEQADSDDAAAEFKDLALENHMHAIALGSADSMYTLANLYLNNYFGEDNRQAGLPLLERAADLGHTESLIFLGHLYNSGKEVEQNIETADSYYSRAALNKDTEALLNYGRFLSATNANESADSAADEPASITAVTAPNLRARANPTIISALEALAEDNHAEAMVVVGNLYARGIGAEASNRTAIRWYKRAVKQADGNADIVNEVAWTLTVSDIEGLQRGKYARRIMDALMVDEEAQDRPEYLDTWAATYAATGDFTQAIKLQERAIEVATTQQRTDVMEILRDHLELFKTGATIIEAAP